MLGSVVQPVCDVCVALNHSMSVQLVFQGAQSDVLDCGEYATATLVVVYVSALSRV